MAQETQVGHPSFGSAVRFWLKLGFISFGGPAGQIAIMQNELVEKRRWISQSRFLHALNFCMLLPGPEAQQLAIYIGWLLHKTWGGIVAGALFVIPSTFVLWTLSYVYAAYGNLPWIAAVFYGLKPAVMAIVAAAVIRIGNKALRNLAMWSIAVLAFVAIFFFRIPFPLIVLSAAVVGFIGGELRNDKFAVVAGDGASDGFGTSVLGDESESPPHTRPSVIRALRLSAIFLAAWGIPVVLAGVWKGWDGILFQEGLFFSKAASVTFGGAYAVLPYVAQQAVDHYGWLQAGQMMDGLGLAETTPGPLIIVTQFVGFMGGWTHHSTMTPLLAATLASFITVWTTFTPCFLWVFLGGPHIEQLRGNVRLITTLSAVTAAVVGVVMNLAVWFGLHVLWPANGAFDWFALGLGMLAFFGIVRWKWKISPVIFGCGLLGLFFRLWIAAAFFGSHA
ncbi:MAG: chromate efflux transporter [Chthoniobacterales bacterium]